MRQSRLYRDSTRERLKAGKKSKLHVWQNVDELYTQAQQLLKDMTRHSSYSLQLSLIEKLKEIFRLKPNLIIKFYDEVTEADRLSSPILLLIQKIH
jgi:hypothetical protein